MLPANCTNRKHEYRIHEQLSNKQWFNLYFTKYCHYSGVHVWDVGLCISKTIKHANHWYNKNNRNSRKYFNKQTGKCGLEGLRKGINYICKFADNLKPNEELHIGWQDEKRKYAYRKLLKYGFYVDEEKEFYHTRNLNYWEANNTAVSVLNGKAYKDKK